MVGGNGWSGGVAACWNGGMGVAATTGLVRTRDGPDWSGLVGLVADAVICVCRALLLQPLTSKHTDRGGANGDRKVDGQSIRVLRVRSDNTLFSGERIYMRYRAQMHGRARMACEIQCMHHAPCTMLINFLGDICS